MSTPTGSAWPSARSSLRRPQPIGYDGAASKAASKGEGPMSRTRRGFIVGLALLAAPTMMVPPLWAQSEKITIGVALAQDDNPLYILMLKGIRARAQELGWEVATVTSNEDKLKQINGVQDLVARGVKAVLISPIDAVGVNAA